MILNDIITGIAIKLDELFDGKYDIFFDFVSQNLMTPCFIIRKIDTNVKPLLGNRFILSNSFCISFIFNSSMDFDKSITEIEECLLANMRLITSLTGEKYNGSNMYTELVDGVLHLFIDYNCTVTKSVSKKYMERLNSHTIGTTKG